VSAAGQLGGKAQVKSKREYFFCSPKLLSSIEEISEIETVIGDIAWTDHFRLEANGREQHFVGCFGDGNRKIDGAVKMSEDARCNLFRISSDSASPDVRMPTTMRPCHPLPLARARPA